MEVKPGYKQTEVGLIPDNWTLTKLSNYVTFKTGPFGSALHRSDYVDGGIPVINPMQIIDGKIKPTPTMAITEQAARKLSDFRLSSGDVIMGRRGEMGRCASVQPEQHGWLCGTGSMIIRPASSLDGRFIQRVLSSPPIIAAINNASVGSTMINLNQNTLGNLLIPIPPTKAEQETIAAALSGADALIESLEQLIVKKRHLKQGTMQELLSGKRRLPGFEVKLGYKQTEVGVIPNDWATTTVGDEFSIRSGKMLDSDKNVGVEKPYVGNRAVQWGWIDLSHIGVIKLTPSDLQHYRLRERDLLVCEGGEIGRAAIWDNSREECYYQKALHRLRPVRGYNVRLMLYMLQRLATSGFLLNFVTQTSIAHLPKDKFETVPIALPPTKAEQEAIAAILYDMDTEIAALEAKLTKARQIKQAMMQELLTGKTRLI